mmetsp:Transcript_37358/g.149095  ORF Transcript_37358/g.149095 Transcript_37358/m.149095 type:complete len:234 (-) Transcript_37358:1160-1861(-)
MLFFSDDDDSLSSTVSSLRNNVEKFSSFIDWSSFGSNSGTTCENLFSTSVTDLPTARRLSFSFKSFGIYTRTALILSNIFKEHGITAHSPACLGSLGPTLNEAPPNVVGSQFNRTSTMYRSPWPEEFLLGFVLFVKLIITPHPNSARCSKSVTFTNRPGWRKGTMYWGLKTYDLISSKSESFCDTNLVYSVMSFSNPDRSIFAMESSNDKSFASASGRALSAWNCANDLEIMY